jgi:very-short-patch-repair endonuclease
MVAINSNKKFYFDCNTCKDKYYQSPNNKTNRGNGCPSCVNKSEQKIADYLKIINVNFTPQYKIRNSIKRYDFYLPDHKLIVEVDGPQHFRQVSNWGSPEENLENDLQKMKIALSKGISILRIYQPDIFSDKIDWKRCIINNLYIRTTPTVTTVASDPEIYNNHI